MRIGENRKLNDRRPKILKNNSIRIIKKKGRNPAFFNPYPMKNVPD
jgi:hypothetical protein